MVVVVAAGRAVEVKMWYTISGMVRQFIRLGCSLGRGRATRVGLIAIFFLLISSSAGASGASLKISPLTGTYEVGSTVDVSFLDDTGGEAINAVQADVLFPADKLQVVNPVASTSFISIWVTAPTYSNTDGTIHFQGGLPNPGIKTGGGVISTVTFRVKSPGKATLKFLPTSQVLRNDGQGTNILSSTGTAEFTLQTPPPAGPAVTSPTHPDGNQWYSSPDVQFSWEPTDGAVGYSFSFDQTAKSTPDDTVDTAQSATSVKATSDGVWYFHLRAKTNSLGGTTSYLIKIDSTPPASFTPKLDSTTIVIDESTTLRFLTTDAASGIDHYEVRQVLLGSGSDVNSLFVETNSPYVINPLAASKYEFQVRAFDRAGNSSDGSARLTVVAAGLPFFARVPFLKNPAVANATLIILGGLGVLSLGGVMLRRVRLRSTFQHDLNALERDAQKKAGQLQKELDQLRQAQATVQQNLNLAVPAVESGWTAPAGSAETATVPPAPPSAPSPPPAPSL